MIEKRIVRKIKEQLGMKISIDNNRKGEEKKAHKSRKDQIDNMRSNNGKRPGKVDKKLDWTMNTGNRELI